MQAGQGAWATAHLSTPVPPHPPWGCSLSRATDPFQKLLRLWSSSLRNTTCTQGSSPIPGCLSRKPTCRLWPGAWLPGWRVRKEAVGVIDHGARVGGCGL